MKSPRTRIAALLITLALSLAFYGGLASEPLQGAYEDDILTFEPNFDNRPIIRIGTQYYSPDTSLLDALQQKFPEYLFIYDYAAAMGLDSSVTNIDWLLSGDIYFDMMITGDMGHANAIKNELFVDLSAEPFVESYLLTSLNDVSVNGHIYMLPGTSTLSGIAYNVDMFEEHGWAVPETIDEFFALCEQIQAEGIQPFSACFKYVNAVNRLLTQMNYRELFSGIRGTIWLEDVQLGRAGYAGFFEPVYELAKRFVDTGVIPVDFFTASLTKQRQGFWAGECAMIDYESSIFTYAESEGCPFELGMMPYPARNAGDAGFGITTEFYISIPKSVERNPERLAFMKEVLAFISSAEGQEALISDSLRVSNVNGIDLPDNPASKYARKAYERGNLYPMVLYKLGTNLPFLGVMADATLMFYDGASVADAIEYSDKTIADAAAEGVESPTFEVIATAADDFTMLETSYYIADKFKEITGADIAIMMNRGFFRSNLALIIKGDITSDTRRYVMKGVGAEDYLTLYKLTGAQFKTLLEHPIINDAEVDAMFAISGMNIVYAPWNARGERVISLTKPDGAELKDDEIITVAAWAGVIPEAYITEIVQNYPELGNTDAIMLEAFKRDGVISPDIANRVKLIWE